MSTLETNSIGKYNGNNVSFDDAVRLKNYTTTQRDSLTSVAGDLIYNSTDSEVQVYDGSSWVSLGAITQGDAITVNYLVVGAGGGGGKHTGRGSGGGGGGGCANSYNSETSGRDPKITFSAFSLYKNLRYNVGIGAGGTGGPSSNNMGQDGTGSYFHTAVGPGGGAGSDGHANGGRNHYGRSGSASGGGGHHTGGNGRGNEQFGYDGGGGHSAGNNWQGGGGGGAGGNGSNGSSGAPGAGGVGKVFTIINATNAASASVGQVDSGNVYYAGGGAGGGYISGIAGGGLGGGGQGNGGTTPGTANTGGGGGGSNSSAGTGGSGVVILRYPSSATINQIGGLTLTTFTESSDKVTAITAGTGQVYWE